jgi:hypothetical protein
MSLYRRKDSSSWWVKLPAIRGESGPLQVSTGTAEKRKATEFHDRLKAERWEQEKLGAKPRRTWEEAALKFLTKPAHKRTHERDKSILRWLDDHLGGRYLDEIDRALIDHIKTTRAKIATQSTANRYLAVIRTVLRKACHEWEWTERVPKVSLFQGERRPHSGADARRVQTAAQNCLRTWQTWRCSRSPPACDKGNVRLLEWSQVDLVRSCTLGSPRETQERSSTRGAAQ